VKWFIEEWSAAFEMLRRKISGGLIRAALEKDPAVGLDCFHGFARSSPTAGIVAPSTHSRSRPDDPRLPRQPALIHCELSSHPDDRCLGRKLDHQIDARAATMLRERSRMARVQVEDPECYIT
jgi:hypothetical protein